MPLGSPPYPEPPYPAGRNAELLLIEYEAEEEKLVAEEVPEPLELVAGSKPVAWVFDAPQMSGGVYHEGAILLTVKYHSTTGYYVPYIWGDNDEAMFLNREVYGWPQLACDTELLTKDGNLVTGTITRRRETLMKASVFLEHPAEPADVPIRQDWLQVRKFPNPVKGRPPLRHLIHTVVPPGEVHGLWTGRPALSLGPSAEFALDRVRPRKALRGFYIRTTFDLPLPVESVEIP
jgi:acetoacetate decarboxylase